MFLTESIILTSNSVDVLQDPLILAAVTLLVILAYHYQRGLTYHEYQLIHSIRIIVFTILSTQVENQTKIGKQIQRYVGNPRLLSEKQMPNEEDEYTLTSPLSLKEVFTALVNSGASPHLISSVKYREHPNYGRQYARAHVIFSDRDGNQTEVWLFDNESTVDIYSHKETIVTDPEGHLTEPYTPGDPDGYIIEALP